MLEVGYVLREVDKVMGVGQCVGEVGKLLGEVGKVLWDVGVCR